MYPVAVSSVGSIAGDVNFYEMLDILLEVEDQ
jgi:hypothetical protein